jgi:hypothetical protein
MWSWGNRMYVYTWSCIDHDQDNILLHMYSAFGCDKNYTTHTDR